MMFSVKVLLFCVFACGASASFVGGRSPLTKPALETLLQESLQGTNEIEGLTPYMDHFLCATEQVVSGVSIDLFYRGEETENGFKVCEVNLWIQAWLSPKMEVTHRGCSLENGALKVCETLKTHSSRYKRDVEVVFMNKDTNELYDSKVKTLFDEFIQKYRKEYSENSENYQKRYQIFKQNLEIVEKLNTMNDNAVYGITKFMDYSYDEYKKYLAPGFTKQLVDIKEADLSGIDLGAVPDSFDWRSKGAVTEVKNQGQCGSCWAFSTTGNVEGQWFLKHGKLYSLSEQELVDCDTLDQGCGGGLPSNAYKSIEKLGGLETESDYPYEAENEKCNINKSKFKVTVNSSVALPKDEVKLAAWLAKNGPISIGINANMMQFYFGGIAHPWKIFCNPKSLDHGVLIVGFGTENGTPFWIIKNSWGPNWGEKGYYRIYRGDGSCGLNQMATSSIV